MTSTATRDAKQHESEGLHDQSSQHTLSNETKNNSPPPVSGDDGPSTTSVPPKDDAGSATVKSPPEAPPDGGYGWVVVLCCFLINMHSWGLNSSYGVFLSYFVNNDVYPGATILDFSFIAGLSVGCAMLLAPVATYTVRKCGTRIALLLGAGFEGLSLISASFTTQIWQLYLSQGVCFGISLGFLFIASVGLVPQWFDKKRSFANAIAAAGSGLGGLVYNLASQAIVQRYGVGWAYRTIGIVACVVCATCAFFAKDRNKAVGARLSVWDTKLFTRMEFNLMQAWGIFSMFGYLVLIYTLPTYATSIGLTASQGSIIGAILNLGQATGRPFVGLFSDRVGRINMASILTFICGMLCLVWWIFAKSFGVLVSFAFIIGTVAGTYWATIAPVSAEVAGLRSLPCVLSMTWVIIVLPTTFTEVIALEIEQHTRFLYAQLYTGLSYIVASLLLWIVRIWKIGQLEQIAAAEEKNFDRAKHARSLTPEEAGLDISTYPKSSVFKRAIAWRRV